MHTRQPELIEKDPYTVLTDDTGPDESRLLLVSPQQWAGANNPAGLVVSGDADPDDLEVLLKSTSLVAIEFTNFLDGRGFTLARLLRERYGFEGRIQARGTYIADQMHYLLRCGFDSFIIEGICTRSVAESCIAAFSEAYQTSANRQEPLFRRL